MKRLAILIHLALIILMTLHVIASSSEALVIRAVYVGSATDAADEYIVLHNNGANDIDLEGLEVEYKSASGKSWTRKAVVADARVLGARADVTLATKRTHDLELSEGFAQAGGNVRIVLHDAVLDQLAWGAGDSPEAGAASSSKPGYSLERSCDESSGVCTDTDNNAHDFTEKLIDATASTQGQGQTANPGLGGNTDDSVAHEEYEITELLPDPTTPQTDAKDEFIEIYNAGTSMANLVGWRLSDGKHSYSLDAVSLAPGAYVAVYAKDSKLSLNNDGDQVLLLRPSGETEFISPNYGKAKSGIAFGATSDGWGWLTAPTPGAGNSGLSQTANGDEGSAKSKTTKTAKATSAKASSKSTNAKTGNLAKASQNTENTNDGVAEDRPTIPWAWILAGLGSLTVGYGAYEYRPEILSFFTKLRAKLGAGK